MAQGKQTPRQKMINLMYLVFIAMLAMQIDQEIIRSYRDTTYSLTETRTLTQNSNKIFEQTLDVKAQNSPDTFGLAKQQYDGLKAKADALVGTIEGIKGTLGKDADYDSKEDINESFAALNNTEASTTYFFSGRNENNPSPSAVKLTKQIDDFRQYVNQTFGNNRQMAGLIDRANKQLITQFKKPQNGKNWLQYKFYNQPLIAALSNLEVIQSSVRGVQSDALSVLLQEKVDADIKFNAFEAIVSAPDVILQGDPVTAKVVIGTYAKNIPGLQISGVDRVEGGQGFKTLNTSQLGENIPFSGKITFNDVNGKPISLDYNHTYRVIPGAKEVAFESGALLSADKMQVLYRGLPNPISGSILGADNTKTTLTASGASVSRTGNGTWSVTPGAGTETTLTIAGKGPKGQTISKSFKFRIKGLPTPVGQIRGESIVSMPASSIPNQKVSVAMPDFDWPVSFSVNSFMFKVPGRAAMTVNGNSMAGVASLIKNLRSGDIAYVYNINASASGIGNQGLKKIPAIVINVQ